MLRVSGLMYSQSHTVTQFLPSISPNSPLLLIVHLHKNRIYTPLRFKRQLAIDVVCLLRYFSPASEFLKFNTLVSVQILVKEIIDADSSNFPQRQEERSQRSARVLWTKLDVLRIFQGNLKYIQRSSTVFFFV